MGVILFLILVAILTAVYLGINYFSNWAGNKANDAIRNAYIKHTGKDQKTQATSLADKYKNENKEDKGE